MTHVNIGSGRHAPGDWMNFDASPVRRIQNYLGPLTPSRFPRHVLYADIAQGLPVRTSSVDAVFSSHILEHMSLEEMRAALRHTFAILRPGGVLRLIVPDLAWRARRYVELVDAGDPSAAAWLMDATGLGQRKAPVGLMGALRAVFGRSAHRWMYDQPAMTAELQRAGFVGVRPIRHGDSSDALFSAVEEADRFVSECGARECALEARKP